jgi:hypothetical protein
MRSMNLSSHITDIDKTHIIHVILTHTAENYKCSPLFVFASDR